MTAFTKYSYIAGVFCTAWYNTVLPKVEESGS